VVGPAALDPEFGPRESGSLAHAVLAEVHEGLCGANGAGGVDPGTLEQALALADEAFGALRPGYAHGGSLAEEETLRRTRSRVRGVLRQDAACFTGFAPIHTEWAFGGADQVSVLELEGVRVRGRVDRIDSDGERLLVMDYKSGDATSHHKFREKGLVQLVLYAEAARSALDLPVVGALYRGLGTGANRGLLLKDAVPDPGPSAGGSVVGEEAFEAAIASGLERAEGAVRGMRSGEVGPQPVDDEACEYCLGRGHCGWEPA
jgi:hypothetical protein